MLIYAVPDGSLWDLSGWVMVDMILGAFTAFSDTHVHQH